MQNFNTNQTRYLYVAGAVDSALDTNLDIAVAQAETGEFYFTYKNADGIIVRSDTIDPKKVKCVSKTAAAKLATPLMKHTITLNTDNYANIAAVKGKTLKLTVTFRQIFDYDDNNSKTYSIVYTVPSTESSTTTLYAALATLAENALPAEYVTVTSSGSGLVITEKDTKFVLGKLSKSKVPFDIAFGVAGDNEPLWGNEAIAASDSAISGSYALADLEYFAAGEKGDYYRGYLWPNDYPFTPAIVPGSEYDVLNIEYFWAGDAENVQKSPRLIQIAALASGSVISTLYSSVLSMIAGTAGSGSGA